MLAAIPIAILTNAARVTATGELVYQYGRGAAEGTFHEISGWLVYLVALALLIGLNFVLGKFRKENSSRIPNSTFQMSDSGIDRRTIKKAFYALLATLLVGGAFVNWFEQRGEVSAARRPLSEMASELGVWRQRGAAIRFDAASEAVLRTTDYTMREYTAQDGRTANLYVGYYASQRTGATYHSPQNCLPGAGWVLREQELVEIKTADGKIFTANKFIVENGIYREVLIYWYQGRGRATASEYADKINTVRDSVMRSRSDGAMVRVMTSVGGDERQATEAAIDLSAQAAVNLSDFVPE